MGIQKNRPFSCVATKLKNAGLRPTKQRLSLAKILFEKKEGCHITAEGLHKEALRQGFSVSLATVYNTLKQFTESNLLREIIVSAGQSYFDSNISEHHHFYYEKSKKLKDIPNNFLSINNVPNAPKNTKISRIDIIVRLEEK